MTKLAMTLLLLASLIVTPVSSQTLIDVHEDLDAGAGYFQTWDRVHSKLILFRDVRTPSAVGVRMINQDGTSIPIYPLKDFPSALRMNLWSVAATPEGGCVVAAVSEFGPRDVKPVPVKAFLLTYDHSGNLTKLWDVEPYEMRLLAVDRKGNVYAIGEKDSKEADYPMGIMYSQSGEVTAEFLPANSFQDAERAVNTPSKNGENQAFIDNDHLVLWLAGPQEMLKFGPNGSAYKRIFFSAALTKLADKISVQRVEVLRVGPLDDRFLFQVRLWPKESREHVTFGMISIAQDGSLARLLGPIEDKLQGRFMGTDNDGKMVFLENVTKTTAVMAER